MDIVALSAVSLILPANNEADFIGAALSALIHQSDPGVPVEIIVVANGCTDATARIARGFEAGAIARGWSLIVIEEARGSKLNALNIGDRRASGPIRIYHDADIVCAPDLVRGIAEALSTDAPRYATGRLRVRRAATFVTRAYATFWQSLPFVQGGAVGTGLYAVNAAGRARWAEFPDIISDDTFVRIQFAPTERIEVAADYDWPMIEGLRNLVRVRRRQDRGVNELARRWPALMVNEGKARMTPGGFLRRALRHPVAAAVYLSVSLAVRALPSGDTWTRGR